MLRAHHFTNQQGFSLLEILIYVTIIAIVTLTISGAFLSLVKGEGRVEAQTEVNASVRFALEKINQDLRAASAVSTPATAGSSSSTLVMTVSAITVRYCVVANQVRRATGAAACDASAEALTSILTSITSLTATRRENSNATLGTTTTSISVSIEASFNSESPDKQFSLTKQTAVTLK
jgi:type II secretory pathway component PulJ